MSYNTNLYNKFCGSNATFHNNMQAHFVPPPPIPPPFFIPPPSVIHDQEFVKNFEYNIPKQTIVAIKPLSISKVREELREIVITLKNLKEKEKFLSENINELSEDDWRLKMEEISKFKSSIDNKMNHFNGPHLDLLHKLLAKRTAKRLRIKRVRMELKKEKDERKKELEERSRKIDENLQKIKDDIIKTQKEQQAKLEADMVLKEVLRKKHDAKKCILKLEALVKLRKARLNTAKGRGEIVSESESTAFHISIEKLKSLWTDKLSSYDVEESGLRAKLLEDSTKLDITNITEREVASNLDRWKEVLFGGILPQVDFHGDVHRFVTARSQWDQYIDTDGTVPPMGWVQPLKTD